MRNIFKELVRTDKDDIPIIRLLLGLFYLSIVLFMTQVVAPAAYVKGFEYAYTCGFWDNIKMSEKYHEGGK